MKVWWKKISDEKWVIVTDPCAVLCELHLGAIGYKAKCLGRELNINELVLERAQIACKRWFRNIIRELAVELEADEPT